MQSIYAILFQTQVIHTIQEERAGTYTYDECTVSVYWSSPQPWWMTSGQGRRTEVLDHHSNHPVKSHMALCHPRPPSATLSPSQWPAKKMNPLRRHPSRLLQRITLLKSETSLKKSSGCFWFLVQSQEIVPDNYLMLGLGPFTSLWWVFMITCRS